MAGCLGGPWKDGECQCTGHLLVRKQAAEADARQAAKDVERLAWAREHLIGQTVTDVAPGPDGLMVFFRDNVIWWRS